MMLSSQKIDFEKDYTIKKIVIKRPNCALDRRTILCLYIPGFQSHVFKHVKILSKRLKKMKEQKKNKGSVLVTECAYNSQMHSLAS